MVHRVGSMDGKRDGYHLQENGIPKPVAHSQATFRLCCVCDNENIYLNLVEVRVHNFTFNRQAFPFITGTIVDKGMRSCKTGFLSELKALDVIFCVNFAWGSKMRFGMTRFCRWCNRCEGQRILYRHANCRSLNIDRLYHLNYSKEC